MQPPDTSIPCRICHGKKQVRQYSADMKKWWMRECGACFGSGLSTDSYDQRRNGTTITIWDSEAEEAKKRLPPGTEFHGPGKETTRPRMNGMGHERGVIYLISWPNQDYKGT